MPIRTGLGLREARSSSIAAARRAAAGRSAPPGVLPDFLIVGAQKAATTSLYAYLTSAPDVRAALRKEVHFFDHHHLRGERWYRSQFPPPRPERSWITGEATPYYLLHPHAPARAAAVVPDARIIVLLRHPVDRAHSHFNHSRDLGREPIADFSNAIEAEDERTSDAWDRLVRTGERQPALEWHSYLRRGLYAAQLSRWQQAFPPESILVLIAEELFADPAAVLQRVRTHLGLPLRPAPAGLVPHHARAYPGLPTELRQQLGRRLAADAAEVARILGRPTGWQF